MPYMTTLLPAVDHGAGHLLRSWRQRRHVSQLDLALRAGVSARHLSFVETGRSQPSSSMILRLCEEIGVPLREQNRMLLAGGFAPAHPELRLEDPPMAQIGIAIEAILAAHLPYPALVIDQGWDLVAANDATYELLDGVAAELLEPPVNVIRLSLHAHGLGGRIVNLIEWREGLVRRLRREYDVSADPRLADLLAEFDLGVAPGAKTPGLVLPLRLRSGAAELSFFSTTTVFGTPCEVTLSELAIEGFYPADDTTRALFGVAALS